MLIHTVMFSLRQALSADATRDFFQALQSLDTIHTVCEFSCLRQIGEGNFPFKVSMKFTSDEDYQLYRTHPLHTQFVETYWRNDVFEFEERDYTPLVVFPQ